MPDRFSYIKKGYAPEEVDAYVSQLEEIIKSYRQKEKAINNAIISAQTSADNIIIDAEDRASKILSEAEKKLDQIRDLLALQKNIINSFYNDYMQLVKKYLLDFNKNDISKIFNKIDSIEEKINAVKTTDEIE